MELPPEQVVLREDGDPNDTLGWHVALRVSEAAALASAAAAAREATEVAAAIEAAAAMAEEQAVMAPGKDEEAAMAPAEDEEAAMAPAEDEEAAEQQEDDGPVDWDDVAAIDRTSDDGGDGKGAVVIDLVASDDN